MRTLQPHGPDDVARLGTVLGVWAHPADDAFLSAGVMSLARAAGNRVVVATATREGCVTQDSARWPPARLARLRSDELAASLAVLGVTEHRWLDCHDGPCTDAPFAGATEQVRRILSEVAPDVVLTFGPDGLTGHDDHLAVSAWTTAAWEALGRGPTLLYATRAPSVVDEPPGCQAPHWVRHAGLTSPAASSVEELALHLRLAGTTLERKVAALRAHASQVWGARHRAGNGRPPAWWHEERFREA